MHTNLSNYRLFSNINSPTYFYSKTKEMRQFLKFILFWSGTVHVSDGLSVHHQESKTVRTATGICQTDSAHCLLACHAISRTCLTYVCCCTYGLWHLMMDGKTVRNM